MNSKKLVSALLFLIAFSAQLFCDEIAVTEVKKIETAGRAVYELTVNNCILIKEIEVFEQAGKKTIKYPQYVSQKKRAYPQVVFLTGQSKEAAKNAVLGGLSGKYPKQTTKFEITRFSRFKKESSLKALCAVAFNGALEVECKIIDGKNGPWVAWPARKNAKNGRWVGQVIITDKKLRENIEGELLSRYESIKKPQ